MKSKLSVPASINPIIAFGVHDTNLRLLERALGIKIVAISDQLVLEGSDEGITFAGVVIEQLFLLAQGNTPISHEEIKLMIEKANEQPPLTVAQIETDGLIVSRKGKRIRPRTPHQREYVRQIKENDLVFSIGPAGTGKTFMAVAVGLHYLTTGRIQRLILTRPVIEAGESLGFLPGTVEEKVDPYIRPLYDAIYDMLSVEEQKFYSQTQAIEIAPLAYMRGRTLSNAFVILDEAQNTTALQMKMFLTRMGENSKMVVTGDVTQIDLPIGVESGLRQASELFQDIEGIAFMHFQLEDVVRHGLVKKILEIYEKRENEEWQKIMR